VFVLEKKTWILSAKHRTRFWWFLSQLYLPHLDVKYNLFWNLMLRPSNDGNNGVGISDSNLRDHDAAVWRFFFQPVFGKMLIPRFWFNRQIVSNVNLKRKKYLDAILLFFNPYNKCLLWKWAKLESKKWVKKNRQTAESILIDFNLEYLHRWMSLNGKIDGTDWLLLSQISSHLRKECYIFISYFNDFFLLSI